MARDRGRGCYNTRVICDYSTKHKSPNRRRGDNRGRREGAKEAGEDDGERPFPKVILRISTRRARIDPEGKRVNYINRLESLAKEVDSFIANTDGVDPTRIQAVECMVHIVRACYTMVKDVDVERLENELNRLKEEDKRAKEESRSITEEEREAKREDAKVDFNPSPSPT
jgi:hypothetical protein